MPVLSMFYGIIVSMYFLDNKKHKKAHIHVSFQGQDAAYSLPEGKVLEGELPRNKAKLVEAWIEIHRDELMADWTLAEKGQPVFPIEPLK